MGKKSFSLGRGLSDILKDHNMSGVLNETLTASYNRETNSQNIIEIDIDLIDPNPFQPRKFFNDDELKELAETIKLHGLLQPISLRKVGDRFQIISGERRTRACKLAGFSKIKAQIYSDMDDKAMAEWALIENIQRVDLNPIETAESYQKLIDNHNYTHDDLSKTVGKSRSAITNTLRLLKLPDQVKFWIQEGKISSGAARALCSDKVENPEFLANEIIEKGLSVRQIEALIRGEKIDFSENEKSGSNKMDINSESAETEITQKQAKTKPELSADLKNFEGKLETYFGTKVSINPSSSGESKGTIVINYYSIDDLTRIQQLMETN